MGTTGISSSVTSSASKRKSPALQSGAKSPMHEVQKCGIPLLWFKKYRNVRWFYLFKRRRKQQQPALSIIPDNLDLKLACTAQSVCPTSKVSGATVSPPPRPPALRRPSPSVWPELVDLLLETGVGKKWWHVSSEVRITKSCSASSVLSGWEH